MSYYEIYSKYKNFENLEPTLREFKTLLYSVTAENLEEMAQKSHELTLKYFGKTIQLYTPMYLSNYCDNACLYCGFNINNKVERKTLTLEEVEKEAEFISSTGLRHILILTGESRERSPLNYIKNCVNILKKYFSSISIEIYPLTEGEYSELVSEGVDSLTIYQEAYDEDIYSRMHPQGPKSDYRFRLNAPERGARAGMRNVNIGVLLGLNDWRREIFFMGLHAKYLQDKFPDVEIGASIPRIRPQVTGFKASCNVNDKDIVQIITALRIFLPRLGITVSTRESSSFRENLVTLGVTRMSAGSTTMVGGRMLQPGNSNQVRSSYQFEILDKRNVAEIKSMLERKGYQPVLKDWVRL